VSFDTNMPPPHTPNLTAQQLDTHTKSGPTAGTGHGDVMKTPTRAVSARGEEIGITNCTLLFFDIDVSCYSFIVRASPYPPVPPADLVAVAHQPPGPFGGALHERSVPHLAGGAGTGPRLRHSRRTGLNPISCLRTVSQRAGMSARVVASAAPGAAVNECFDEEGESP
jgi:hypothetical protein